MIFQPVDVAGPAHRGAQVQKLAQNAAQNVMRRQRMRLLLKRGASAAGRSGGAGSPFGGSMHTRPTGVRGKTMHRRAGVMLPGQAADEAATMVPDAVELPSLQGAAPADPTPDMGGPEMGAPETSGDPNAVAPYDPSAGYDPNAGYAAPTTGAAASPIGGAINTVDPQSMGTVSPLQGGYGAGSIGYVFGAAPNTDYGNLIPLNGGLFYDPATDSISGGGGSRRGGR